MASHKKNIGRRFYAIESNSKETRPAKADNGIEKETRFAKADRGFGNKKSET